MKVKQLSEIRRVLKISGPVGEFLDMATVSAILALGIVEC
jgi:hypothetical protein